MLTVQIVSCLVPACVRPTSTSVCIRRGVSQAGENLRWTISAHTPAWQVGIGRSVSPSVWRWRIQRRHLPRYIHCDRGFKDRTIVATLTGDRCFCCSCIALCAERE
ncbi:unnamed protein product [Ectocarpus sp. 8 AP-2014]